MKKVIIFGTKEDNERIYGKVFEQIGIDPIFIDPTLEPLGIDDDVDLVFLKGDFNPSWRTAAAEAKKKNIPIIYMLDGVIEWSYIWNNNSYVKPEGLMFGPTRADYLCVLGQHQARILASLGHQEKIRIIGSPRLDDFNRTRELNSDQKPKILITTANVFGHNVEQKVLVKKACLDLKEWFNDNTFVKPVWRISEEIADAIKVSSSYSDNIEQALRTSDALISFTSTTILEGLLKGLPVAQIDYRTVPQFVQTAWNIRSKEHIENVIQELLHPPEEKIAYQNYCLQDELQLGESSLELKNLIQSILSKTPQKDNNLDLSRKNSSQDLDYRHVHKNISAFSLSDKSLLQYELDGAHKLISRYQRIINPATERSLSKLLDSFLGKTLVYLCGILSFIPFFKRLYSLEIALISFLKKRLITYDMIMCDKNCF